MEVSTTIELSQFRKNNFMAWTVSSQTWNTLRVKLTAGSRVYFDASKDNHDAELRVLAQGSAFFLGEGELMLTVTVDNPRAPLKSFVDSEAINNPVGKRVGYVYYGAIEDDLDEDYNDVYFNLVAWEKHG
ncbi:MAG: hypothetical protein LBK67_00145 [Coriobacteriales bacterium]|jgi:hypothetical protein|nr:hypothetical protein [Coriobacteriales bacterium]